jgi:HEAT repeat protein
MTLAIAGCASSPQAEQWSSKEASEVEPQPIVAYTPTPLGSSLPRFTSSEVEPRAIAIDFIRQAANAPDPQIRANAVEASQHAPEIVGEIVRPALGDENRGVRFVAAMLVGNLSMSHLALLLEPLLHDESVSVRAAALYAQTKCGQQADLTPLASMMSSDDPEQRGNAALILGELGNTSAVPMIKDSLGRGMQRVEPQRVRVVEIQVAESLVKLGQTDDIEVIRAALFAPPEQSEVAALASLICGRLKDRAVITELQRMAGRTGPEAYPSEVRLAATIALAQMSPDRAMLDVPRQFVDSPEYQLRRMAAITLGEFDSDEARDLLATLLDDPDPTVQIAAATALLKASAP